MTESGKLLFLWNLRMKNYSIILLIIRTNQVRGEEKRTCCTDKTLIRKTSYSDHEQRFILIGFGAVLKPPGEGPSRSCYCLRFPSSPSRNCQAHFCPQRPPLLVWLKALRKKKVREEDTPLLCFSVTNIRHRTTGKAWGSTQTLENCFMQELFRGEPVLLYTKQRFPWRNSLVRRWSRSSSDNACLTSRPCSKIEN